MSTYQVRRRRESPLGLHKGSLKVAPPEQRKSPTCASFRVRGIEIACTVDQALGRDLNLHEAALFELPGGNQLSPRKPAVGSRKIRREIDRLLKEFLRETIVGGGCFSQMPQPSLIGGPSVEVLRRSAHRALLLGLGDDRSDRDRRRR